MSKFPESSLLIKAPNVISAGNESRLQKEPENDVTTKIWVFKDKAGYELQITLSRLTIVSNLHKTYNNKGSDNKFREIIEFVLGAFGDIIKLQFINRVGLRYIDECPLPSQTSDKYKEYFNSALSLSKNAIENIDELHISLVKNIEDCKIICQEHYCPLQKRNIVILDFDGFKQNVAFNDCMITADKLHGLISIEYENTVKEPIYKYMDGEL